MEKKKTVVIGASPNPSRYSYLATNRLKQHGHEALAVGMRGGDIDGTVIDVDRKAYADVDTVTLYVGPRHQHDWKEYIYSLKPKRVIFNPGTENPEFEKELAEKNIETEQACTLVMLGVGNY